MLICALLIAYAVVMYRRRENRTPEDEFQIADDGGFGKIVNVNDYKIPSQTQQPPVANPQDSNQQAPVPYSGNVLMPPCDTRPVRYFAEGGVCSAAVYFSSSITTTCSKVRRRKSGLTAVIQLRTLHISEFAVANECMLSGVQHNAICSSGGKGSYQNN